ncbi:SGNH/GDSL hydrolase family protein [Lentzea tibetensis]|uniref:SGNH/GDSL hydrolase family protein n=1 Tax=Lentzea tibetensis TaxID=2591470 RepID=UPI001F46A5BE|nr:SGNH/GDSL hydrolase family protein [Lentzea tibetensis]
MGGGAPAPPPPPTTAIRYVALGDSYSSGVAAGDYGDSGDCKRSAHAYPVLWAAKRKAAEFGFVACSGATTADVRATQLSTLRETTTHVTISIGGNDAGFFDVMTTCTTGTDQQCADRVEVAKTFARTELPGRLNSLYQDIRTRSPRAKVVVVGYPRLYEVPAFCPTELSEPKRAKLNEAADVLVEVVKARANAKKFTFVPVGSRFAGHRICSADPWLTSLSVPVDESFHPNRNGQELGYLPALEKFI